MYDIEEAIDRVMLSLEKRNRVMSAAEKERVAYHEAGHALVALMNSLGMPTAINGWGELHRNETAQQLGHATRISGTPLFDRASVFNACRRLSGGLDDKTLDPGTPIYRGRNSANRKCRSRWLFGTIGSCCAWVGLKIDDLSREQARTRSQFVHLYKSV